MMIVAVGVVVDDDKVVDEAQRKTEGNVAILQHYIFYSMPSLLPSTKTMQLQL